MKCTVGRGDLAFSKALWSLECLLTYTHVLGLGLAPWSPVFLELLKHLSLKEDGVNCSWQLFPAWVIASLTGTRSKDTRYPGIVSEE